MKEKEKPRKKSKKKMKKKRRSTDNSIRNIKDLRKKKKDRNRK